ncbi:hypothetical protein [Kitasatospora sp. DSM 101779]|uniref:hypothetical protein n=1 Tax=Kitasatospora sp. DSM 101779 TaxID=2853165 RepID=UPI0021D993DF|nr:hypothetical protein [Kitasatospora sp. DSM 101779]MCU7826626.1 hypothetical protein [Kitasatospora sp. DSM 101779]
MGLENDLNGMFAESVHELSPPIGEMVAEGKRAGRKRLRIRRTLQAAGAAAVVAAVLTAVAVAGPRPGGARADGPAAGGTALPSAASPAADVPATASPATGKGPSGEESGAGTVSPSKGAAAEQGTADLTWQAMTEILADLLPPGARLGNLNPHGVKFNTKPDERYIELEYDDGHGPSTVMLTVSKGRPPSPVTCENWQGGSDEGTRKPGYEKPLCETEQLPDGGRLRMFVTGTDVVGLYDEMVDLTRPDGTTVQVVAANGTLDQYTGRKGLPITVTRERPPLGLDGWKALVQSPRWQLKVPQSVVDSGRAFARTVTRFPCPDDARPADCKID